MIINCLIVDDEVYARETLADYIRKTDDLQLSGIYGGSVEALKAVTSGLKVDLLFLDIDMPEMSGLELAKLLPGHLAIIYITGHANYAVDAFETNVYDFIVKPVSYARFLKAVQKVKQMHTVSTEPEHTESDYIFINPGVKSKLVKFEYKEILYIQGLKNYIVIYSTRGKQITYLTMKEIGMAMPKQLFMRIHKSYIINLSHIQQIEGNMVVMSDQQSLPLGGAYKNALMELINKKTIISSR